MEDHDAALLTRVRLGDRAAFDELFESHHESVHARVLRVVQDPSAAEDTVQETFYRVWTKAHTYAGRGPVAAWIHRIAHNLAVSHLRSRPKELPMAQPWEDCGESRIDTIRIVESSAPGPEAELERRALAAEVRRLVAELPDTKRDVIRLIHGHDMTVEQAATALGVPPGTVKSRLYYGRKALEQQLREYLDD